MATLREKYKKMFSFTINKRIFNWNYNHVNFSTRLVLTLRSDNIKSQQHCWTGVCGYFTRLKGIRTGHKGDVSGMSRQDQQCGKKLQVVLSSWVPPVKAKPTTLTEFFTYSFGRPEMHDQNSVSETIIMPLTEPQKCANQLPLLFAIIGRATYFVKPQNKYCR